MFVGGGKWRVAINDNVEMGRRARPQAEFGGVDLSI